MSASREDSLEKLEKRKLHRFPVQLPVELGSERDDLSSICTTLSTEGISVETALVLTVGERLSLAVVIAPRQEPLRMVGQVVWRRELSATDFEARPIRELGIRFLRPLPSSQQFRDEGEDDYGARAGVDGDVLPDLPPFGRP